MTDHDEGAAGVSDAIGELCALLRKSGLTLTLYGKPISEGDLRSFAETSAQRRLLAALRLEPGPAPTKERIANLEDPLPSP